MHICKHFINTFLLAAALCTGLCADGSLECINDPPPPGANVQPSEIDLPTGFQETSPSEEILTSNASTETNYVSDILTHSLNASVDTCNGNVRISFKAGGSFPADNPLTFYHNSVDGRRYPMGVGRNHTYNIILLEHPNEWHMDDVRIVLPNGYRLSFDHDIDGSFRGQPGIRSHLTSLESGGYLLYTNGRPNMVDNGSTCYCFGPADDKGRCRLVYIKDTNNTLYFSYVLSGPAAGELETIKDEVSGSTVTFLYDSQGRLESVTSLDGIKTRFTYNSSDDILQATSQWGALNFDYDAQHNIVNINDGLNGHSISITYGLSARCKEFRNTSGDTWTFNFITDPNDKVASAAFGLFGATPSVFEFNNQRLIIAASIPGKPRIYYSYSGDKQYLGAFDQ